MAIVRVNAVPTLDARPVGSQMRGQRPLTGGDFVNENTFVTLSRGMLHAFVEIFVYMGFEW